MGEKCTYFQVIRLTSNTAICIANKDIKCSRDIPHCISRIILIKYINVVSLYLVDVFKLRESTTFQRILFENVFPPKIIFSISKSSNGFSFSYKKFVPQLYAFISLILGKQITLHTGCSTIEVS